MRSRSGSESSAFWMSSRRSDSEAVSKGDSACSSCDEVAELGLLFLADRLLERDRELRHAQDLAHLLGRHLELVAISSGCGSRPSRWTSWRSMCTTLFSFSTMCTGMRIVRALSAIARVTAWRIHHVAYVENL